MTITASVLTARRSRAFTLIEILVVAFIISILAGLLVPSIITVQQVAKDKVCRNNLKIIGTTLGTYLIRFNNFLPEGRQKTDGTWYRSDMIPILELSPNFAFSWQQILDKTLEADRLNDRGFLFTQAEYSLNENGAANLVNERGASPVWKCPVAGTSKGMYFGSDMIFNDKTGGRPRNLRNSSLDTGSVNLDKLFEAGAVPERVPVCADGSSANTEDRWLERYRKPQKELDDDGEPIAHQEHIHMVVTGPFNHTVVTGNDAGKDFINLEFRHQNHANVLTLSWAVEQWDKPDDGPLARAELDSDFSNMKRRWDSLVILYDPNAQSAAP